MVYKVLSLRTFNEDIIRIIKNLHHGPDKLISYFGLPKSPLYETLFALIFLVGYVLIIKAFFSLLFRFLEEFTKKTKTRTDDLFIFYTRTTSFIFFYSLGIYYFFISLEYFSSLYHYIKTLYLSFLVILFGWYGYNLLNVIIDQYAHKIAKKTKTDLDESLIPILNIIVKIIAWIVIGLEVLSLWNIDLSPLLASAGIVGLVIGFAAQETIKNLFGGMSVSFDKSLRPGDWVLIDGAKMKVMEVNLRSTKFLTLDGTLKIYPNSTLAESVIENLSQPEKSPKKVKINVGVAYGSDPEKVKKILKEEALKIDKVDKENVYVFMTNMGAYSIDFLLVCDVPTIDDVWPVKTTLIQNIYKRLGEEGIEIPFPTNTVYLREEKNKKNK